MVEVDDSVWQFLLMVVGGGWLWIVAGVMVQSVMDDGGNGEG